MTAMFVAAALSALVFIGVLGWRVTHMSNDVSAITATVPSGGAPSAGGGQSIGSAAHAVTLPGTGTTSGATSSDDLSQFGSAVLGQLINSYVGLQTSGVYSTSTAEAAAQDIVPLLKTNVTYQAYTTSDIRTTSDTSYDRMLAYRSDLRASLAPLLKNTEPEYAIFASYVQSKDARYLQELRDVAQNYRDAASLTAEVVAPADAAPYHVAILNAMQEFAAVLDSMSAQADDPFAVAALLQSYNQAESDMLTSFNALTTYYRSKKQ